LVGIIGSVKARTAQVNQIRGLLAEFGLVLPQGISHLAKGLPDLLEDAENGLPGSFRQLLRRLHEHLQQLDRQVVELEREIQCWHKDSAASQRLAAIPGMGPLSASAFVATVGDGHSFSRGRQLAACLGMVPRQASSGGKTTLLGMSKHGDSYLRTLLIHGARSVVRQVERHPERADPWLRQLLSRRPKNVVAVALANKNARVAWALLTQGQDYERRPTPATQ
jgi:transposase